MPLDGIDHHPRRQRIIAAETLEHGAILLRTARQAVMNQREIPMRLR
jgi:hypothetical protein